jgi:hypothetical protein
MDIDTKKIDEAVLALLHLTLHDGTRAWKGFDWDTMNRLHRKGFLSDPVGKAKSVVLTDVGLRKSERLFKKLFAQRQSQMGTPPWSSSPGSVAVRPSSRPSTSTTNRLVGPHWVSPKSNRPGRRPPVALQPRGCSRDTALINRLRYRHCRRRTDANIVSAELIVNPARKTRHFRAS